MAQFLTTRGLGHQIEEIIITASKDLIILTPFIQFSGSLYDRLTYTSKKEISITIIYGKTPLSKKDEKLLRDLNCSIYVKENLHAKCYLNENLALVTSMNLYEYSETNNEEAGILINEKTDQEAFQKCKSYVSMIIGSSRPIRVLEAIIQNKSTQHSVLEIETNKKSWEEWMRKYFSELKFEKIEHYISAKNYLNKEIQISNQYGFITVELPISKEEGKRLKETHFDLLKKEVKDYRCFWNSPFHRICLYSAENVEIPYSDATYFSNGVIKLLTGLKKLKII